LAALQGKTVKQDANGRPFSANDDAAWQELKVLVGRRIDEGLAGGLSAKDIDTMIEEELG
jgi:hypothetical protein